MKKIFFPFISLLMTMIISTSCEKDDPILEEDPNVFVNDWILENMQFYYLWNKHIPSETNKKLNPDDYFETLLYPAEDRFSWIQDNFIELMESLAGVSMEAGYDFTLGRGEGQSVIGIINYVKPNSPASGADLKRGDYFLTINDTEMTMSNYATLLNATTSPHTLGTIRVLEDGTLVPNQISLQVVKYEENPLLLDTIYNINNTKVGYLVYNFFAEDKGDNTNAYVRELNDVFLKYKTQEINELILDLRYNSGGALITSVELGSMISGQNSSEIFTVLEYNADLDLYFSLTEGSNYNKFFFAENIGNTSVSINKLTNLPRLYVLVSERTASASEVLINGLKPYMDVILVGETTVGKNVGSTTIYEKDPVRQAKNKWGMQPIIVKLANSRGETDFSDGFVPDVEVSEYAYLPLLPFGDTKEPVLQVALVKMGLISSNALRAAKKSSFNPVYSSADKNPVRTNTYLPMNKHIE
jgi:C-terminal processing protease CtpA/Prc